MPFLVPLFFGLTLGWTYFFWWYVPFHAGLLPASLHEISGLLGLMGPGVLGAVCWVLSLHEAEIAQTGSRPLLHSVSLVGASVLAYFGLCFCLQYVLMENLPPDFFQRLHAYQSPILGWPWYVALVEFVLVYTLCEELGWRRFAFSQLLKRYPFVVCTIILGAVSALWHMPLVAAGQYEHTGLAIAWMILHVALFNYVLCWVYVWSGHRLFLVGFAHGLINFIGSLLPEVGAPYSVGGNIVSECLLLILVIFLHRHQRKTVPFELN